MKEKKQNLWVGVEQLENDPAYVKAVQDEFVQLPLSEQLKDERTLDVKANRRDFLKYLGFGLGAATVAAGCDIPVRKAIPYVEKPDDIVPGVATYYASSFVQGGDYCAVLVKTREGRPIKIEGNDLSAVTRGGTSARAQASVLSLYDTNRFSGPQKKENGEWVATSWAKLDKALGGKLTADARIRIVTSTLLSPAAHRALEEFKQKFPNAEVVTYDPVSCSAMLQANEACFGQRVVPNYRFDKAETIVSFGADFLGTWISPIEYAAQYAEGRKIQDVKGAKISHHVQVESGMTLTGSNADNRILVKPSEMGAAIAALYNSVAKAMGAPTVSTPKVNERAQAALEKLGRELVNRQGRCLVVSGTNNTGEQILVNAINHLLGNYGKTLGFRNASLQRQGIDADVQQLIKDMNAGQVDALFVWGANPAFDLPNAGAFAEAMQKVGLKVSFAGSNDDTTDLCDFVAPAHHYLESWGDAQPKRGHYSLMQPTIRPLFDTRQAEESLLRWAGSPNLPLDAEQPYYEYLRFVWKEEVFPKQNKFVTFQAFWDSALHDGVFEIADDTPDTYDFAGDVVQAAARITKPSNSALEISFFETVNMGAGQYADNPWLQEMPDPVTRCVWGNYLAIPIVFDGKRRFDGDGPFSGLNRDEIYGAADKVQLTVNGTAQTVTAVRQFGQMRGTVAMALGYGRQVAGPAGKRVGTNVHPWLSIDADGNTQYFATDVQYNGKVGVEKEFACVQYHHTMGVKGQAEGFDEKVNVDELAVSTIARGYQGALTDRTIIYQGHVDEVEKLAEEIHHNREHAQYLNEQSLYPYEEYKEKLYDQGHHWGMHIDLNACIGCGACQVACIAENNVPIVGKHEVWRHHEMTWLRIDRYFYGDYENPNTVYQPMMCQHCDNAPCENVCPVSATVHSSEGLNQMAYNRCIGTRYCANNCPYKVRRFNWLDYTSADLFPINEVDLNKHREGAEEPAYYLTDNLTRMVLNPDVTVRSRGVMEKCSFCVQRIQEGKLAAKREGRKLQDGEVKTACMTACPTGAITFGDFNDPNSQLNQKLNNPLNYVALEETDVRSCITYQARVHNRDEELA